MSVFKNDVGRPSNKTIIIRNILKILLIVVIALFMFIMGYLLNNNTNNASNKINITTTNKENKEVSNKLLNELISLIQLNNVNGIGKYSYPHDILTILLNQNGKISDMSDEIKIKLIYKYAENNNMLSKVYGEEYKWYLGGTGYCDSLSYDNALKIASKYGISDKQ